MFGSQVGWSPAFLKPNGSDHNLFFSSEEDAAAAKVFPGATNLSEWSGHSKTVEGPVTCGNTAGESGSMVVSSDCSWGFDHNVMSQLLISRRFNKAFNDSYLINLDCEGNWANCDTGTTSTRVCLDPYNGDWAPIVPGKNPGQVQNAAWNFSEATGAIVNEPNGKCIEVCERGGDVGGCNGQTGSIVQLRPCTGACCAMSRLMLMRVWAHRSVLWQALQSRHGATKQAMAPSDRNSAQQKPRCAWYARQSCP